MNNTHDFADIQNEILSIKQACFYTGLSEPSLRKLAKEGKIPRRKFPSLGRDRFFYIKSEVDNALQDQHDN